MKTQLQELEPDLILMAGDMINDTDSDVSGIVDLCGYLVKIAPVYYILGNHEGNLMYTGKKVPLDKYLYEAGVHFMYTNYETITVNGNVLKIGAMAANAETYNEEDAQFEAEFEEGKNSKFSWLIIRIFLQKDCSPQRWIWEWRGIITEASSEYPASEVCFIGIRDSSLRMQEGCIHGEKGI
ncbi:MAG: metallophosphoesterase [Eisenbergiella sp.]